MKIRPDPESIEYTSDLGDLATRAEEQDLARALMFRQAQLPQIGRCHNCAEPLNVGVFCDADCREDFNARSRVKSISGVH